MSSGRSRSASVPHLHPWWRPFREALAQHGSPEEAKPMQAYMKDVAPFFGVKATPRRALFKEHLAEHGPPDPLELPAIVRSAFAAP